MKPTDPAYFLLEQGRKDPSKRSTTTVFNPKCYICKDPEFALMGVSLCFPCGTCGAHVPADDSTCDNGHDNVPT
jgi:hypothetical protein